MKVLLTKDKNRRNKYLLLEKKRKILKSIINNLNLPKKVRTSAYRKLIKLPIDSSPVRLDNRCVISNRSKSVYKRFKISRILFREMALNGSLVGVKKASW